MNPSGPLRPNPRPASGPQQGHVPHPTASPRPAAANPDRIIGRAPYNALAIGRLLAPSVAVGGDASVENLRALMREHTSIMALGFLWSERHGTALDRTMNATKTWERLPGYSKAFSPKLALNKLSAERMSTADAADCRRIDATQRQSQKVVRGAAARVLGFELPGILLTGQNDASWTADFASEREIHNETLRLREMLQREIAGGSKIFAGDMQRIKAIMALPIVERFFISLALLDVIAEYCDKVRVEATRQEEAGGPLAETRRGLSAALQDAAKRFRGEMSGYRGLMSNLVKNVSPAYLVDANETLVKSVNLANETMFQKIEAFFISISN